MFLPSREQARRLFFDAWRKYRQGLPLEPLEGVAAGQIAQHPEYQAILEAPERHLQKDYLPEQGETNPFLHLAMHLAIEEQLSIDQPAGVKARYERLLARLGDAHAAQHEVMDCLAEMIWQAQRYRQPFDGQAYLDCLTAKAED